MPKHGNPFVKLLARDLIAAFGAHNLKNPHETGRIFLSPQKIQVHDDWNPKHENYDADIAIATFLAGAITFSTYVQPICLWNEQTDPSQIEGHIGGWGQSENLEKPFGDVPTILKVPIHTNEFCFLTTKDLVDLASNRTFCAGRGDGTGVCEGDSGGGLSIKVGPTFYFRGIVSSGLFDQFSCDVSKFSIFTDVLKFKPWIDQIISERRGERGKILVQKAVRVNLICTIRSISWTYSFRVNNKESEACFIIDQNIDREGFFVESDPNLSILALIIQNNKEVKFLPSNIVDYFHKLRFYEVENCSIKTVNRKHFNGLNKLERLDLSLNEIELIDRDSFKDLNNLKSLDLSHNKIKTIDPKFFQSLETLLQLMIGNNQIEFLDGDIFVKIKNVRFIDLEHNKLSTIPADLFKNNLELDEIWLHANEIQAISPTMFDHLLYLHYVDLRINTCVDDSINQNRINEVKNVLRKNCKSPV